MLLIVDANIVLSALVFKGKTGEIFEENKVFGMLELNAPEYLLEQIEDNALEIMKKSKLTLEDFKSVLGFVTSQIRFIEEDKFSEFLHEAEKISPYKDFPYVALALSFKSKGRDAPIWSNDKDLAKVPEIKVISTHELCELLRSWGFLL